jgi:UrcA family protein
MSEKVMINKVAIRPMQLVLAAIVSAVPAAVLVAQQQAQVPEVKIEATRQVKTVGRSSIGAPIEVVSLTHAVNYKDLDLSTSAGADTLRSRVSDTAKATCNQLDTLYPLNKNAEQTQSCVKQATDAAMAQANSAIASAQQKSSIHTATAPSK